MKIIHPEPPPSHSVCDAKIPGRGIRVHSNLFLATSLMIVMAAGVARAQYTAFKIPPGYVQIQGDIITETTNAARLQAQLQGSQSGIQPRFAYSPSTLWPNRIVPYDFDSGVTAAQQAVFLAAMTAWQNSYPGVTTISFQPRNGQAGYLHMVVANPGFVGGSTSSVGYNGGQVTMTVHSNAVATFLIAHELGHALGLWHEQARNDRDTYVTIATGNILNGYASQFAKASPQSIFGPYDYDSIMHYFACAFSVCDGVNGDPSCSCPSASCDTIQVVSPYNTSWACNIGQQNHLSAMDQRSMAFLYGPPNWVFLYPLSGSTQSGAFQQPYLTMAQANSSTPSGSTLWVGPGTYSAAGLTITTPMTIKAAIADLQLQSDGSLGPSSSGWVTFQ